jgi:hypothetical protein
VTASSKTAETHTTDLDVINNIDNFDEYRQVKTQAALGPSLWSTDNLLTRANPKKLVIKTI